jgi:serine/threonine protein kinase
MTLAREQEFRGTERFQIQRRLGAGGFGVVYQALDLQTQSVVALKALRDGNVEALFRLKREFRALAGIAHENLVRLHELLADSDQWFFTMELIDGVNFLHYVRGTPFPTRGESTEPTHAVPSPAGRRSPSPRSPIGGDGLALESAAGPSPSSPPPLLVDRLRSALRQTVAGIQALHVAGRLHRDVKPSNVLVSREERVVLLDFGMVTDLSTTGSRKSISVVGTPAYMSPEQGSGGQLTETTDWYSVGVMLFEALTGQWPFTGSFVEMMWDKRRRDAPAPRDLVSAVPDDLNQLCVDLLRRDPARRPGADEIRGRLGTAPPPRRGDDTPPRPASVAPPFVGRDEHLATLDAALEAARAGAAVVVRVHGPSGAGKTALARRFLSQARRAGAVVLEGRCYEREYVPFKALDSLVDSLSQFLKKLPAAEVNEILPRDVLALARLFPVLRRVEAVAGARRRVLDIADSQELRRRAFAALRELLARLAEQHDVVLFIDDLQWGDVDSAALLADLLRPPRPPSLLLIACYRAEETATSVFLREFLSPAGAGGAEGARDLPVGALSEDEARDLTAVLLGGRASHVGVEEIVRESRGNPFFLSELVRYAETGVDPSEAGGTSLEAVIRSRIARLPEPARLLLEILAVAGAPMRTALALHAAGIDSGVDALELLKSSHLARTRSTGDRDEIEPYHDRIRETVVAQLDTQTLRAHHRRLALALEGSRGADPEALALHFQEAGDADRAAEYAAAAGQRAAEALAFDRSARLYRLALELTKGRGRETRRLLRTRLGDVLVNAGRGAEAARAYLDAMEGASPDEALELQRRAAEQFLISGHMPEGLAALRAVVGRVGLRMPGSTRTALVSLLVRLALLRIRGTRFRERDTAQIAPDVLTRIDVCWSAAKGLTLLDPIRGQDFQARHFLRALRAGEPYRMARALTLEAGHSSQGGLRTRARTARLLEQASMIGTRLDHPHAIGLTLSVAGTAAFLEGRWRDAVDLNGRAEPILRERCRGVAWELDNTHYYSLTSLYYLGELRRLAEALPAIVREAEDRGDRFALTTLRTRLTPLVLLAAGEPERARQEAHDAIAGWPADGFLLQHWYELTAEAESRLYEGAGFAALRLVWDRWPAIRRSFLLRVEAVRIHSMYLRGRAAVATAAGSRGEPSAVDDAESDARRIEKEGTAWGAALARLVRAGAASVRRDRGAALEHAAAAEQELAAADMALHAAVARRRRGELLGGAEGAALVAAADEWMAGQTIAEPARVAAMLAPGAWA